MTEPSRDDLKPGITPGADLPVALDDRPLLSETPRSWIAVSLTWAAILAGAIALFKYAVISLASLAATLALYEVAVRRLRVTRWLFGMRPESKRGEDLKAPPSQGPGIKKEEATWKSY